MKNLNDLATIIAKNEGLKKQVNIAQIKEILHIICKIIYLEPAWLAVMLLKGAKGCKK